MPFHRDTKIPYFNDGVQMSDTLEFLAASYKAIDRPIRILSLTKEELLQEANAVEVGVKEITNTFVTITFNNGFEVICTNAQKWSIASAANIKQRITAPLTGFTFLATEFLAVGDRIVATNEVKYLEITAMEPATTGFEDYLCMRVTMFGNFLIQADGAEGQESTFIVSCTC